MRVIHTQNLTNCEMWIKLIALVGFVKFFINQNNKEVLISKGLQDDNDSSHALQKWWFGISNNFTWLLRKQAAYN